MTCRFSNQLIMQTKLTTLGMSLHKHDCRATYEHLNFLSDRPMSCVCLHVCIMIPHGEELTEKLKNLTVRQEKRIQEDQARGIRMSQSTTNQSDNGHPPKLTPQIVHYLHNLFFCIKWHRGYQWKSVEFLLQFR